MTELNSDLARDTLAGLSASPKYLLSKYFYDAEGSRIFQQIMRMPEYYLTDCELEIFRRQAGDISASFREDGREFDLIEFGAGDGLKTRVLLQHMLTRGQDFNYLPIDISAQALNQLCGSLKAEYPELRVEGLRGDYFSILKDMRRQNGCPKVILFLGSNIGNFNQQRALQFLRGLRGVLSRSDKVFIGFDLKKEPQTIIEAYNDPHGFTRDFNLNLLRRLNRELGADFITANFMHCPVYDPADGAARSYLLSTRRQVVHIEALQRDFTFEAWEAVFTEMSRKFDDQMIEGLARESGFRLIKNFYDERRWFADSLWQAE